MHEIYSPLVCQTWLHVVSPSFFLFLLLTLSFSLSLSSFSLSCLLSLSTPLSLFLSAPWMLSFCGPRRMNLLCAPLFSPEFSVTLADQRFERQQCKTVPRHLPHWGISTPSLSLFSHTVLLCIDCLVRVRIGVDDQ